LLSNGGQEEFFTSPSVYIDSHRIDKKTITHKDVKIEMCSQPPPQNRRFKEMQNITREANILDEQDINLKVSSCKSFVD